MFNNFFRCDRYRLDWSSAVLSAQAVPSARSVCQRVALVASLAAFLVATAPLVSEADDRLYGNFMGDAVTFIDVKESSLKTVPLYGSPTNAGNLPGGYPPCLPADNCTITGNALTFSPQLFVASSNNQVPPSDETDGQLTFMIESKPGQAIENVHITEGGALSVGGFVASNTDDTYVDVSAIGFVTVLGINGGDIDVPLAIPIDVPFNFGSNLDQDDGTWRFASEGAVNGFLWNGTQLIDVQQALLDSGRPITDRATKVTFNLDNILFAQSELLGNAQIDKKLFFIVTVNIPEPASGCLLLIGLAAVGLTSRRLRR